MDLWDWQANAERYWKEVPLNRQTMLCRAVKEVLRWTPGFKNQWVRHDVLFGELHCASRYAQMEPKHIHAAIVYCNLEKKTFDVYFETNATFTEQVAAWYYQAIPVTTPLRWHTCDYGARKRTSKQMAYFLRKIVPGRKAEIADIEAYLHTVGLQVPVQEIIDIAGEDCGRFNIGTDGNKMYVSAAFAADYRRNFRQSIDDHMMARHT